MQPLRVVDGPADDALISAVRDGDVDAYAVLYLRHVAAARRLARQLASPTEAEDLVAEAFSRVLAALRDGGGPDLAFRAYLLTAIRRLQVDRLRRLARVVPTDDQRVLDLPLPFTDVALQSFDNVTAVRAFASLPERWQVVLWHTEVEQESPADLAPLLGLSANSVAALAYRAREGLRQAFLTAHAADAGDERCAAVRRQLGGFVRTGRSPRRGPRVEQHLQQCRACSGIYLELVDVNATLAGLIAAGVLGPAAAGYSSTLGSGAGLVTGPSGGDLANAALDRARDLLTGHTASSAVVGVTAATVVTGGGMVGFDVPAPVPPADRAPAALAQPRVSGPDGATRSAGPQRSGTPRATRPSGAEPETTRTPRPPSGSATSPRRPPQAPEVTSVTTVPATGSQPGGQPSSQQSTQPAPQSDQQPGSPPASTPASPSASPTPSSSPSSPASAPSSPAPSATSTPTTAPASPTTAPSTPASSTAPASPAPASPRSEADLAVSTSQATVDGGRLVTVTVSGLESGEQGWMGFLLDPRLLSFDSLSGACSSRNAGAVCRVADGPATFTFRMSARDSGRPARVVFAVGPADGLRDPNPRNNLSSQTIAS